MKKKNVYEISGPDDEINQCLEPMINYFISGKGNLYSYLKTLDDETLVNLADCYEKDDKKHIKLCFSMAILALGAQFGTLEKTIDELIKDSQAFCMYCALAFQEKLGLIILEDKSKIWDLECDLKIRMTDKCIELAKGLGLETGGL